MGRDKLSEKVKKVTINIPEEDIENINFVAKLQGKTTSSFIRDVLKVVVEIEIRKRNIYIFDEQNKIFQRFKIDITNFDIEFDDYVDHDMRDLIDAKNQGYISFDEDTEMPIPFLGIEGEEDEKDYDTYLCFLISAKKEKKLKFWTKVGSYTSDMLKTDEEIYIMTKDKIDSSKIAIKKAWGIGSTNNK